MIHLCRRQDEDISAVDEDLYRGSSDEGEIDCEVTTQSSEEEEEEDEKGKLMEAMTRGPSREPSETADDLSVCRRTPQDLPEGEDSPDNAKISDDCVSTTTPVDDSSARGSDERGSGSKSENASPPNLVSYSYYSDESEEPDRARTVGDALDVPKSFLVVPPEIYLKDSGRSVCARATIPKGTRYGPFLGKWLPRPIDPRFAWEILLPGKKKKEFLDGTLEPKNWMKFVRTSVEKDHNLRLVVFAGQIFYEAIQDICETDELLLGPKEPILLDVLGESIVGDNEEADEVSQHSDLLRVKKEDIKDEEIAPFCTICNKAFSSLELLGEHLVKVHKYPWEHYKCERCPQSLLWRPDLFRHHASRQGPAKKYPCENCSKVFTDASNLQRHIRIHHVGARSHACPECGKTFSASSGLKQHMHIHSSYKPFKCKVCFKSYTQFSNLCRHRRMREKCRLYIKCKTCGQHFSSASSHSKHRRFCESTSPPTSGTMALPISQSSPTLNMQAATPSNPLYILPRPHLPFYPSSMLGSYPSLFPSSNQQPSTPFINSPVLFPPVKTEETSHKMISPDYQSRGSDQKKWFYDEDGSLSPNDAKPTLASNLVPGKEAQVTPPPASAFKTKVSPSAAEEAVSLERPSPARPSVGGATCTYPNPRKLLKSESKEQKEESGESKPNSPVPESGKEQPLDLRVTRKRKLLVTEETVVEEKPPSPKVSSSVEPKKPKSRSPSPARKEPAVLEPKTAAPAAHEASPVPAGSAASPPTMAYPRPIHPMLLEAMYRPSGFPQIFPHQNGRLLGPSPHPPPPFGPPRTFPFLGSVMNGLPNGQSSQRSFDLLRSPLSGFTGVKPYQDVLSSHISSGGPPKMKDRYGCTYCGKIFPRSANLTRHVRTHTGEQPYKCQYCERSFSISSNLQRHVRNIHNKEKPFKCPSCERCFGQQTNLDRHLKKHEADDGSGTAPVADSPESNENEREDACFDEIRTFMGKVAYSGETTPQMYSKHSYGSVMGQEAAKEGDEPENRSPGPDYPQSRSASSKNHRLPLAYDVNVNVKADQEALNNNGPDHEPIEAAA